MPVQNNHMEGPGSSQSNSSQSPHFAPVLSTEGGWPVVFIDIEKWPLKVHTSMPC